MAELIENVAIAAGAEDKHNKEDCPFCNSKDNEPIIEENELDQEADEDIPEKLGLVSIEEFKLKNCAGQLGTSLGGEKTVPEKKGVTRDEWKSELEVAYAAHHLIPGYGSLQKSTLYTDGKYLIGPGQKVGNIGYNVNCKANGVWLPGNYAYSQKSTGTEWGKKGKLLKEIHEVDPSDYVSQVITDTERQFHDAHGKYNIFVKNQINAINNKLNAAGDEVWCEEAKKRAEEKEAAIRPLYILIGRLAHLSNRMKRKLTFPTSGWNTNIYTSSFARNWMLDFNKKL